MGGDKGMTDNTGYRMQNPAMEVRRESGDIQMAEVSNISSRTLGFVLGRLQTHLELMGQTQQQGLRVVSANRMR